MKAHKTNAIQAVEKAEIDDLVAKTAVLQIRVTPAQKRAIKINASYLGLTATDYLIKCHELIAVKMQPISPPIPHG